MSLLKVSLVKIVSFSFRIKFRCKLNFRLRLNMRRLRFKTRLGMDYLFNYRLN